jgi:hypothetical protein
MPLRAILISCVVYFISASTSLAAPFTAISGWAWSDTAGWISFNCIDLGTCGTVDYKMTRDTAGGDITGYAWSETVGWISANSSDLTGCPSNPCSFRVLNSGKVIGWIKVKSAGGGWDGFIHIGDNPQGSYGVDFTYGALTGWAWGDTVMGWIFFSADLPCSSFNGNVCNGRETWMFRDTETVIAE